MKNALGVLIFHVQNRQGWCLVVMIARYLIILFIVENFLFRVVCKQGVVYS